MTNITDSPLPGGPGDTSQDPDFGRELPSGPAGEDAPIGSRVGHNPANVGNEVAEGGDIAFPEPALRPAEI